jgi:hypothetical protein
MVWERSVGIKKMALNWINRYPRRAWLMPWIWVVAHQ